MFTDKFVEDFRAVVDELHNAQMHNSDRRAWGVPDPIADRYDDQGRAIEGLMNAMKNIERWYRSPQECIEEPSKILLWSSLSWHGTENEEDLPGSFSLALAAPANLLLRVEDMQGRLLEEWPDDERVRGLDQVYGSVLASMRALLSDIPGVDLKPKVLPFSQPEAAAQPENGGGSRLTIRADDVSVGMCYACAKDVLVAEEQAKPEDRDNAAKRLRSALREIHPRLPRIKCTAKQAEQQDIDNFIVLQVKVESQPNVQQACHVYKDGRLKVHQARLDPLNQLLSENFGMQRYRHTMTELQGMIGNALDKTDISEEAQQELALLNQELRRMAAAARAIQELAADTPNPIEVRTYTPECGASAVRDPVGRRLFSFWIRRWSTQKARRDSEAPSSPAEHPPSYDVPSP